MSVKTDEKIYILENSFLKKEIFIRDKKILSGKISNKLSGSSLDREGDGEEFIIRFRYGITGKAVRSSQLTVDSAAYVSEGSASCLVITFCPVAVRDSSVAVKAVYELSGEERFIKKFLDCV